MTHALTEQAACSALISAQYRTGDRLIKKFIIIFFLTVLFILPALTVVGLYLYFSHDLPRIESLKDYAPALVTEVYGSRGELMAEFSVEKRYMISYVRYSPGFHQGDSCRRG